MDKRGEGTTCRNEFAPRVFAAGRMGPIRAALLLSLGALVLAAQLGAATKTVLVGPDGTLTFRDMESGTDTTTVTAGDRVQWEWVSGFHSPGRRPRDLGLWRAARALLVLAAFPGSRHLPVRLHGPRLSRDDRHGGGAARDLDNWAANPAHAGPRDAWPHDHHSASGAP